MMEVLHKINILSRNCLAIRENLILLEAKRELWIKKSKEFSLAFVGGEEDGVTIPIENETIIKELENRRDAIESDYAAEKAKLIEVIEIFKENENN